jgi:lipopolysaccharide heptosyltransferase II
LEVWLADIPRRIGRVGTKGRLRSWLIHQPFPEEIEKWTHERDQYLALARWLGAPEVRNSEQATGCREEVTALSQQQSFSRAGESSRKIRIAIAPGAEYGSAKRWPADRFRKVMDLLSLKQEMHWILVGTAAETPIADAILTPPFHGQVENKIGKTTLAELIELLSTCDLLLTNDTGTMHLATVLGIPTVAIFGSTDPSRTGPQGAHNRVLQHLVPCSPCFLRDCPIDFPCMLGVTPEEVVEAMEEKLRV